MKFGKKKDPTVEGSVRVAQGTYQKALVTKLLLQLGLALLALVLVYLCFAATIVRVVPSSAGMVPLKNNTYPGGQLPVNSQILIRLDGNDPVGSSVRDRLQQAVVPQKPSALVSVLAGPIGRVKWTGGILTVNGKVMSAPFPTDPHLEYLNSQYVAVCIKGDCTPGSAIVFEPSQVLGVPLRQNAPIPPAPPLQAEDNNPRSTPEGALQEYLLKSAQGKDAAACGLVSTSGLKSMGGEEKCAELSSRLGAQLGGGFDPTTDLQAQVVDTPSEEELVVQFTWTSPLDGSVSKPATTKLVKTDKGWAIFSVSGVK